MLSTNTRQAYTEIDNFIELLDEYNKNKIPKKLREFFKKEKDNNYNKVIDANIPIKDQDLKEETLALIAYLNLQYWCEDEEEKKKLKAIYAQNEQDYQNSLREKYNPDDIFKKKKVKEERTEEKNMAIIEYKKNNIFIRIKTFIKNLLNLK